MAAQVVAIVIFLAMFVLIILDKWEHYKITLACAGLTLVFVFGVLLRDVDALMETLNVRSIFTLNFWHTASEAGEASTGINWATIIFIAGMMVMVAGMERVGFFRWLCMVLAKAVHYKPIRIFLMFMALSFVLAMFIDSITVILFLATVTLELAELLSFNPVPFIIAEIFFANLGGSATMCGDPPNIIIGTSLGFTFFDFVTNTGLIAVISLVVMMAYFYLISRREILDSQKKEVDYSKLPDPSSAILDRRGFYISTGIFLIAVAMLITHANTGLTVAFIGVFIAILTLITAPKHMHEILKAVDYKTLLFFIGLFVVVGGLEQTGVLNIIAEFIAKISEGNPYVMVAIIIWISGIASAFVDNIPFSATMIPIIQTLAATQGVPIATMAWGLSMGTDIGGSATPIGASANVVGTSASAKAGHPISWGKYCLKAMPATAIVLLLSTLIIFARYM